MNTPMPTPYTINGSKVTSNLCNFDRFLIGWHANLFDGSMRFSAEKGQNQSRFWGPLKLR